MKSQSKISRMVSNQMLKVFIPMSAGFLLGKNLREGGGK